MMCLQSSSILNSLRVITRNLFDMWGTEKSLSEPKHLFSVVILASPNLNSIWCFLTEVPSKSHRVECNIWPGKYIGGIQQQTTWRRRKDQSAQNQGHGTHPIRAKGKKWEHILRNFWDKIKQTNFNIIRAQEKKREKGAKNLFEKIIVENT